MRPSKEKKNDYHTDDNWLRRYFRHSINRDGDYCNDGDWIESCTALVEDETGDLSILNWAEERERLKLIYFEEKKKMKENAA